VLMQCAMSHACICARNTTKRVSVAATNMTAYTTSGIVPATCKDEAAAASGSRASQSYNGATVLIVESSNKKNT
jgi:hypothetical protein